MAPWTNSDHDLIKIISVHQDFANQFFCKAHHINSGHSVASPTRLNSPQLLIWLLSEKNDDLISVSRVRYTTGTKAHHLSNFTQAGIEPLTSTSDAI